MKITRSPNGLRCEWLSKAVARLARLGVCCLTGVLAAAGTNLPTVASAGTMEMDSGRWRLVLSHDFSRGDRPSLYSKYCGSFGLNPRRNTNFSPANVYWRGGALVLKFEKRRNRSCTGDWADYAGGGVRFSVAGAKSIAVEAEIVGNDVRGSHSYLTTWPETGQPNSCEWGAEDDFYEQVGRMPRRIWASSHFWTSSCQHQVKQFWYDIINFRKYNAFGIVRETFSDIGNLRSTANSGCVDFYVNGRRTGGSCNTFRPYLMTVSGGIGGPANNDVEFWRLPTTMQIRKIRIWNKRES